MPSSGVWPSQRCLCKKPKWFKSLFVTALNTSPVPCILTKSRKSGENIQRKLLWSAGAWRKEIPDNQPKSLTRSLLLACRTLRLLVNFKIQTLHWTLHSLSECGKLLPFVMSQEKKVEKIRFSTFALKDTKIDYSRLISPFRYKAIPAEAQVNLSPRPLVSVLQATTYKSVPLCLMELFRVSSVPARISTSTHPIFGGGGKVPFAVLWEALYNLTLQDTSAF